MRDSVMYVLTAILFAFGAVRWVLWYRRTPRAERAEGARDRLNANIVSWLALWMQTWLGPFFAAFFLFGAVVSFVTGHWPWGLVFLALVALQLGLWRFARWGYRR